MTWRQFLRLTIVSSWLTVHRIPMNKVQVIRSTVHSRSCSSLVHIDNRGQLRKTFIINFSHYSQVVKKNIDRKAKTNEEKWYGGPVFMTGTNMVVTMSVFKVMRDSWASLEKTPELIWLNNSGHPKASEHDDNLQSMRKGSRSNPECAYGYASLMSSNDSKAPVHVLPDDLRYSWRQ